MPHLDVDDARLWYGTAGDTGPLVVLVHGGFCDSQDWEHQIEGLSGSCRVAWLDLRGHGRSTTARPETCTVEHFSDDVAALVRHIDAGPAVLVGHSLGCRILLETARRNREVVQGLVLVDGSRLGAPGRSGDDQAISRSIAEHGHVGALTAIFDNMFVGRVDPDVRAMVMGRLPLLDESVALSTVMSTVEWDAEQLDAALTAVDVPTLAVQSTMTELDGTRRSLADPNARTAFLDLLAGAMPTLQVRVVTRVGHFCMLESPEEVTDAIEAFARDHEALPS